MNSFLKMNKQLLAMTEERIAQIEKKESAPANLKKIPSQGQAYFYKSKTVFSNQAQTSLISNVVRVEQDAAFVVTDLYITAVSTQSIGLSEGGFVPDTALVKFVNTSSGRDLTISTNKEIVPESAILAPSTFFDFGVPLTALIPLYSGFFFDLRQAPWSLDYHYPLPCEYLLPRGATVDALVVGNQIVAINESATIFNIGIDYVLGGYKVFGA